MMLRIVALAVCVLSAGLAQGPLRFELKRIEKQRPACLITFEYPEIISAASPEVRDRINKGITQLLLRRSGWPADDSGFRSLDAYANAFLEECSGFQTRPEAHDLYEHKTVTILRYTPPILSFRCDSDEDAGGVHPFGNTLFVNFETGTGRILKLSDLVKEDALPKLTSLAEAQFRRDRGLSSSDSVSEQGYNFPGGHFRLNDNFGAGEKELLFVFNTYEIAAGAAGPTEIAIPYQVIRNLLKPDLHLERR